MSTKLMNALNTNCTIGNNAVLRFSYKNANSTKDEVFISKLRR